MFATYLFLWFLEQFGLQRQLCWYRYHHKDRKPNNKHVFLHIVRGKKFFNAPQLTLQLTTSYI